MLHLRKMSQIASTNELVNKIKPWKEFLNGESFSKPSDGTVAQTRLTSNFEAYMFNYAAIVAATVVLAMATEPRVAFFLAAGGAFAFAYFKNFKGITSFITFKHFSFALGIYAAALVIFTDTLTLLMLGFAFGSIACISHAVMHEKPADFI